MKAMFLVNSHKHQDSMNLASTLSHVHSYFYQSNILFHFTNEMLGNPWARAVHPTAPFSSAPVCSRVLCPAVSVQHAACLYQTKFTKLNVTSANSGGWSSFTLLLNRCFEGLIPAFSCEAFNGDYWSQLRLFALHGVSSDSGSKLKWQHRLRRSCYQSFCSKPGAALARCWLTDGR